jgi:hypothetical protein
MRTRNALDRLATAGRPWVAGVDSLVDLGEEDGILAGIVASERPARRREIPRRRTAIALAGAVVVVAALAAVASGGFGTAHDRATGLSGARIQLAGYHFRTPAGFTASDRSCGMSTDPNVVVGVQGFAAAASADGGCVEAYIMLSSNGSAVPAGAAPVTIGAYQAYLESSDSSGRMRLYVRLPDLGHDWQAVVLFATGLTSDQLVAVAQSGLPATPSATYG